MKAYIKLARPHHWIKNFLVLLPLLCSGHVLEAERLLRGIWGFFAFSLMASAIYCINDVKDREKDQSNPAKCSRPVAAGVIPPAGALCFGGVLFLLSVLCGVFAAGREPWGYVALGAYFLLNLAYSLGLKNVPLLDIAVLVSGFLLRMLYGGQVTEIVPSKWLCLTVVSASFYLGLGKRRGELRNQSTIARSVLRYYSESFLDRSMYMCLSLAVMFYALWTMDALTVARVGSEGLIWTVPLVILICMKYSLDVEGQSDGDPVEVLLGDKVLLLMALLLAAVIGFMIYGI